MCGEQPDALRWQLNTQDRGQRNLKRCYPKELPTSCLEGSERHDDGGKGGPLDAVNGERVV